MTPAKAEPDTANPRLRQFGLREALAFTTCLAVTLAIYRESTAGVAKAILLTIGVTLLAWYMRTLRRDEHPPVGYQFGVLMMVTLIGEMGLAWLSGYLGDGFGSLWIALGCCRLVMVLYGLQLIVVMPLLSLVERMRSGLNLPKRIHWISRVTFTLLCVPYFYAAPLHDLGRLTATRAVGGEAIVRDGVAYRNTRKHRIVRAKSYPVLARLSIHDCIERRQSIRLTNYLGETRYELFRQGDDQWRLIAHTYTRGPVVIGDWPAPEIESKRNE